MARLSRRGLILGTLSAILVFEIDSMWLMLLRNTYMITLAEIRDVGPRHLPGSKTPIRPWYTGIGLIDYWAAIMNTILANVTDGSAPRLSTYAFHFTGQLGSITTVLMMEAMRAGNRWTLVTLFMPWGLLMTAYGYAVIMPLYGIVHILVSPTALDTSKPAEIARQILIIEYPELWTLPGAIVLGYGLPVLLMALPILPPDLHQLFVAGWHLFPIWVTLSQFLLKSINTYPLTITQLNLDFSGENLLATTLSRFTEWPEKDAYAEHTNSLMQSLHQRISLPWL